MCKRRSDWEQLLHWVRIEEDFPGAGLPGCPPWGLHQMSGGVLEDFSSRPEGYPEKIEAHKYLTSALLS